MEGAARQFRGVTDRKERRYEEMKELQNTHADGTRLLVGIENGVDASKQRL